MIDLSNNNDLSNNKIQKMPISLINYPIKHGINDLHKSRSKFKNKNRIKTKNENIAKNTIKNENSLENDINDDINDDINNLNIRLDRIQKILQEYDNKYNYLNNNKDSSNNMEKNTTYDFNDLSYKQFITKLDLDRAKNYLDDTLLKQTHIYEKNDCDKIVNYTEFNYKKNFNEDVFNPFLKVNNTNNAFFEFNNNNIKNKVSYEPIKKEKTKVDIFVEINTIDDLIRLTEEYPLDENIEYNLDMKSIHAIKTPLIKLKNMIGMNSLKQNIVDQILYFIQNLQTTEGDFMHTCIYGPPGTGKTEIAKIMGEIFSNLGVLNKKTFKKVTRADLVAGYLGQTALKTKDVIRESLGGVLFIDEAYALGNPEKRDSFAKECIDTLCEALSDHKHNLMVIIAGYEKDLDKCFFSYNQGLRSRFTWSFKTDDYNANELKQIFIKKINDAKWKLNDENTLKDEWFKENKPYFKFYGRDMETLFSKVKICHGKRVFCLPEKEKRVITLLDLEKGFQKFLENDEVKKRKENKVEQLYKSLYM